MAAPIVRFELRRALPRRRGKTVHTHTVAIAESGPARPLCDRVELAGLEQAAQDEDQPTCPACRRKLRELAREAVR